MPCLKRSAASRQIYFRRNGVRLAVQAVQHLNGTTDSDLVREAMCGRPTSFMGPPSLETVFRTWRILQWRQVFRLALEGLLHWVLLKLEGEPMRSSALVGAFLSAAGTSETTGNWLSEVRDHTLGPMIWSASRPRDGSGFKRSRSRTAEPNPWRARRNS